uniref:ribosomal protein S3 n=1 Tax=Rufoboletus hainanensis TaxID=1968705 RepID=UPI0028D71C8D|nr:ribosomal protein S3 [Butyriboletus hainanensis]WMX20517.1 ribosomal protein S3 [Butyriboletus hainanensis]
MSMNPNYKGTEHNPSYVIGNFNGFFKNSSKTKMKFFRRKLKSLQFYSKQIKNYQQRNNTLDLVNITKEQLNIQSKINKNSRLKNVSQINDNMINKYIDNNIINNIKFSLNLLVNNNTNNKIKNINYIRLISKYQPDLAVSKNNIYKFNINNTRLIKNIYTLLHSAFISMRCLISQPRISYINEKIFIQLFFYPDVKLSKHMKEKWSKNIITKLLSKLDYKTNKEINNLFKSTYFNSKQKIIKLFNKLNFNDQKEVITNLTMPSKQIKKIIDNIIKKNESLKMSDINAQKRIIRLFNNAFINYNKPIHYSEDNCNINKLQNNSMFLNIYNQKLKFLAQLISKIFNKPVQLELIRLHYPFYDPNIIVNLLSYLSENLKIRRILGKIYKSALITKPTANIQRKRFSIIPGYLTGLTIKFAGRFPTQKIVPRKTVKTEKIGSLARKKAVLVETARFSNKNRRGSFSISVSTGLHLNNFLN